jgi:hypothetical protein
VGLIDWLKERFAAPPSDVLSMEPQCLRHRVLTLRLPAGWQFTHADSFRFSATGPGGCSVKSEFRRLITGGTDVHNFVYMESEEVDKRREEIIRFVEEWNLGGKANAVKAPEGILWIERSDVEGQNARLQIAVLNFKLRDPNIGPPPMLHIVITHSCALGTHAREGGARRLAPRNAAKKTSVE